MTSRRQLIQWAAMGATLGRLDRAWAGAFPEKAIKLVVPYPSGGGADQWCRIVAGKVEKLLGQPIVFDYKPGASTTIGADAAAKAPADGYTIHLIDSTAFAYVPNMRKVPYDALKAFTPLVHLGDLPFALLAHPSVPVKNLQELIAYAKANPNKLNCASAGVGSPHHLIAEILKQRAGISMNHVPYKGSAQYMADLVGGQVDLAVSTLGPAMPHIQTGRIRALAVSSGKRSASMPDVPTIAEQGFEGFDEKPWNCFVTNAGVPADALERLRTAFRTTLDDPEVLQALRKTGVEEIGRMPLTQITEQMRLDYLKWGEVIRRAKITVDS
jgi:tripartite-type tricarboxylate transporter receptor subunit TctC